MEKISSSSDNYQNSFQVNILVCFFVFASFFIYFILISWKTGLLTSGFRYFIDDHQVPNIYHDLGKIGYLETLLRWMEQESTVSRFRPFYPFQIVLLTQLFGLNSTLWFLYINLLASLSSLNLFIFSRLIGFPFVASMLLPILTFFGWQSEIWIRPLLPDAYAMFFLSFCVVFSGLSVYDRKHSGFYKIFLVVFSLPMSLSKESYIIFIPTLMFLQVWIWSYFNQKSFSQSIKENYLVLFSLSLIFTAELGYILFFLGTGGTEYAGVDKNSFDLLALFLSAQKVLFHGYFIVALLLLTLLLVIAKIKGDSLLNLFREIFPFFLLLCLALVPHIFLYSKSGIVASFYLYPAILMVCLFLVKILSLFELKYKFFYIFAIALVFFSVLAKLPAVKASYAINANEAYNTNSLIKKLEVCTVLQDQILVVINPRIRYEASFALKTVLDKVYNRKNLVVATYGLDKTNFHSTILEKDERAWMFLDPEEVHAKYNNKTILNIKKKDDIRAIVIFDNLDHEFEKTNSDWFNPRKYEFNAFQVSYYPVNLYCRKS